MCPQIYSDGERDSVTGPLTGNRSRIPLSTPHQQQSQKKIIVSPRKYFCQMNVWIVPECFHRHLCHCVLTLISNSHAARDQQVMRMTEKWRS